MPKGVITVLLFLATAFIGYYFVLGEWDRYQSIQGEMAHFDEIRTELNGLLASFADRVEIFESIPRESMTGINEAIPESNPVRNIMVGMEYLAASRGVSLQKMAFIGPANSREKKAVSPSPPDGGIPGQPKPSGAPASEQASRGPQELGLQITALGSYENFKAFLVDMEKNLPLFDVESLGLAVDDKNNFTATVKLKTYYH